MNSLVLVLIAVAISTVSGFDCPDDSDKRYVDVNDCSKYFWCYRGSVVLEGACGTGTTFHQSSSACDHGVDDQTLFPCTLIAAGPAPAPVTVVPVTQGPCLYSPVVGDASKFFLNSSPLDIYDCGAKMVFDNSMNVCTCVSDGSAPATCNNEADAELEFENNLKDSSCNSRTFYSAGSQGFVYETVGHSGAALLFAAGNKLQTDGWNNKYVGFDAFMSIAFFIKSGAKTVKETIVQYGGCTGNPTVVFKISLGPVIEAEVSNNQGNSASVGGPALAVDVYSHVVMTFDGNSVKLYVNGVEEASAPLTGGLKNALCPLVIGNDGDLKAELDTFTIFSKGLSQAEVTALSNA